MKRGDKCPLRTMSLKVMINFRNLQKVLVQIRSILRSKYERDLIAGLCFFQLLVCVYQRRIQNTVKHLRWSVLGK